VELKTRDSEISVSTIKVDVSLNSTLTQLIAREDLFTGREIFKSCTIDLLRNKLEIKVIQITEDAGNTLCSFVRISGT
jgi:hypothetical protein